MKKILYISYDGMTDPLGQSQVLPYLAGLSKLGFEFTLLSFEKKERFAKSAELIQKICADHNIKWEPSFFTRRPPVLSKLWDNWQMKRKVRALHKKTGFDFTHCRSYVPAAAGLSLWRSHGVPFLFDMRGFWVDERVDNGQWNLGHPLYKLAYRSYKKKEQRYFDESAHIISLTHKGKEELVRKYHVLPEKVSVIPCCADLEHFNYQRISAGDRKNTMEQTGIAPEDKILCYLGSLGGWYLTREMLDFFVVLKKKQSNTRFLFITHDKRESILALAAEKGIAASDIITVPATRAEVPHLLAVSDWSVFFIKDAYSKKASSPTKQGEIMAMGVPIICNDIGDTGRIVTDSGTGIVIRNFDQASFEAAAAQLPQLEDISKEKIRNAAFQYYDLANGVAVYEKVYNQLTK